MSLHMRRQEFLPSIHSRDNDASLSLLKKQKTNIMSRLGHEQRKWFQKRGKAESIIFTSEMLSKLRDYFNDLDADRSGAIGTNELEDPFITLELCSSKNQVRNFIQTIDLDGSGEVQFAQFLEIFKKIKPNKYVSPQLAKRYQSFREMFNNQNKANFLDKNKSYQLALSELRRKKLISDLTNKQVIKPRQKRYQKKDDFKPNFLKKIQRQFIQTPELNSKIISYRTKDYYRVKLIKDGHNRSFKFY